MKTMQFKTTCRLLAALMMSVSVVSAADPSDAGSKYQLPKPDGKPADVTKPVKVFRILGQSNAVGLGSVTGDKPGTLENAVKTEKLYPFLVDDAGNWVE